MGGEGHPNMLYFPFVAILGGLLLDEANKKFKFLGIPDSVNQFLFALVATGMMQFCLPTNIFNNVNSHTWANLEPETILTILLPPLLFESSFKINAHSFFAKKWYIIALTSWAYVWTLVLSTGMLISAMRLFNGSPWQSCGLFVSIIVATDPVAVVAMLEQYGAPHRLRLLIEGESLLNDGLALTAFKIFKLMLRSEIKGEALDWGKLVDAVFMCIVVSPPLGMTLAWITAWFVKKLENPKARQGFIIVSVYGTFIAQTVIGGSSALGLVCFGVTLGLLKEDIGPDTSEAVLALWQTFAYCCNNIIFIFSGYMVGKEIFYSNDYIGFSEIDRRDLFTLLEGSLLYFIPLFARVISIYFFYHLYYIWTGRWLSRSDYVILAYAGLRGALGLILALELTKDELAEKSNQPKVILLLTCATTVLCLLIQGISFPGMAKLEGTTKRSRYTRESNQKLSKSLRLSLDKTLREMQKQHPGYLHGANWQAVAEIIKNILKDHERKMDHEVKNSDDLDEDDLWDGVYENEEDDETRAARQRKRDETDAKIGLYGILLARVHEAWRIGMTSGETSHVIVSLLEHGIDEGMIEVKDIQEHLNRVDANWMTRQTTKLVRCLHGWLRDNRWMDFTDGMAGNPLFPEAEREKQDFLHNRSFEKWWIFHTTAILGYNVLLAIGTFSTLGEKEWEAYRYAGNCLYFLLMFSTFMEFILLFFVKRNRFREAVKHGNDKATKFCQILCSSEGVFSLLNVVVVEIGTILNALLQFHEHRVCNEHDLTDCRFFKYGSFTCSVVSLAYRLSRMLPLVVVLSREYLCLKSRKTERVRLAILFYLAYLVKDTSLPKDLFNEATYKIVRREARQFSKLIDAVLRNELKEHTAELDLVSVIKSRQAVRMMSHVLKNKLEEKRREGFIPEDVEERWNGIVREIRDTADKMFTVTELDTDAWLDRLTWTGGLGEAQKRKMKNLLVERFSISPLKIFERGEKVHLSGIAFVKKGVCKVTEGICNEDSHEFYVNQGEIMGLRNLLIWQMKQQEPTRRHWSPFLPHRKYLATTYLEINVLEKEELSKILAIPNAYRGAADYVQKKRIVAEVKRLEPSKDLTVENFDRFVEKEKAQKIVEETLVELDRNQTGIVGCWTKIVACRPAMAIDLVNRHIHGPAKMLIAPVDGDSAGFVFIQPQKEQPAMSKETYIGGVGSSNERSNFSLMQTVKGKEFIRKNKNHLQL